MASTESEAPIPTEAGPEENPVDGSVKDATEAAPPKEEDDDEENGSSVGAVETDPLAGIWDVPNEKRLTTSYLDTSETVPEDDAQDFDVVQVHGLYGGSYTTWGTNWAFHELHKKKYTKSRLLICDYSSSSPGIPVFTMEGLKQHATEILDDLLYYRQNMNLAQDNIRPIVFVGHDIGGVIIKLALWIGLLNYGRYRNVIDSVRTLVFFGCPHRSASTAALEDMVTRLFLAGDSSPEPRIAENAKTLTKAIIDINAYFKLSNLASLLEVINFYSTASTPSEYVFDRYTATFGLPFEEVVSSTASHQDLAKEPDMEKIYPAIDRSLASQTTDPDEPVMETIRTFHNIAPVASLTHPLPSLNARLKWITQDETFTEWLNGYGSSLLYLHGKKQIFEASTHVVQAINDINSTKTSGRDIFFNFRFSKHNDERNTIMSFLTAFLAQVVRHRQSMTDFALFRQFEYFRSWAQTDLFYFFSNVLNHNDHDGIIVVIDRIDQCDDSRIGFIQDLCRYLSYTEHRIKVLITGKTESNIECSFSGHKTIDLDQHVDNDLEKHNLMQAQSEYAHMIQQNPTFTMYQRELREFLVPIAHDQQLLRFLANRLVEYPHLLTDKNARAKLKTGSSTNVREICLDVVGSIPSSQRQWARKVLLWTLLSFRPLRTWELHTVLTLESQDDLATEKTIDEFERANVVADIAATFQGLLIIKDHEIHPAHPEVRSFFIDPSTSTEWYNITSLGHEEIVQTSMAYFCSPQMQKAIAKNYLHDPISETSLGIAIQGQPTPVFPESFEDIFFISQNNYHRYSFCSYATRYWVKHYNVLSTPMRTTLVKKFLDDKAAFRAFAQAHWWLENPLRAPTRMFISPLPLLAHLGLEDLIHMTEETDAKDRGLALVEASRNGHAGVVRMLMQFDDYTSFDLDCTLNTGSICENEELLIELVTWAADLLEKRKLKDDSETKEKELDTTIKPTTKNAEGSTTDATEGSTTKESASSGEVKSSFPFTITNTFSRAIVFSFEKLTRLLLKHGADVQGHTTQNYTSLDFALRQKNPEILKVIIENKVDLGANDKDYFSNPLHRAVSYGDPELVQQLVDAGVDLNLKNSNDATATYLAVWRRHYRAVEPLVKAGADLQNDSVGVWTPLTCCARRDTRKCGKILLENKANVDVIGFNEWTPLRSASYQGYTEFCRLLFEHGADPNNRSGADGVPIMTEPCRDGNLELVKMFVEHGAEVRAADKSNSTALLNAAVCGYTEIAEYLIDNGADITEADGTGFNAVTLAAYATKPETAKRLAKKGVDIHKPTTTDWTAIHYAYDDAEVTRVLIEAGADINHVADKYTPLLLAATYNKLDVVKELLKHKANLEITYDNPQQNYGLTALGIAINNGYIDIASALLDAGANVNQKSTSGSLCMAFPVANNNLPLLKLLLEYRPDLSLVNSSGHTALHCIGGATDLGIAKALVNAGAPLEIVNERGYTPLGEAVVEQNVEIMNYLISKGSNINTIGGSWGGPIHLSARSRPLSYLQALLDGGGDVNLMSPRYGSAVQTACVRWTTSEDAEAHDVREEVLKYLIEEKQADLTLEGGMFGCALNALCAFANPEMVKVALDKGVKISVPDLEGRQAIHFSTIKSMQNFLAIHSAGGDLEAVDKVGRTVLHWAVIGGNVDIIERVLSLNRQLLYQKDNDGWTPLLWACRGAGTLLVSRSQAAQKAVIALLIKRGADTSIIAEGGGGNRHWSPLSVARFNSGEAVEGFMEWLTAEIKGKDEGGQFNEDADVHKSKKGKVQTPYCDSCLMNVTGFKYKCKTCPDNDYCMKCFQSVKKIHDPDHEFTEDGPEWEEEEGKEDDDDEKKNDDEDSSEGGDEEEGKKEGGDGEEGKKAEKEEGGDAEKKKDEDSDTDTDSDTDDDDDD